MHVDRTIALIRDSGCRPGLVFNPATPLNWLDYTIDKLDLVLIMSVNPGFGGQQFIPRTLGKLAEARARIEASGRDMRLEIDGGIKVDKCGRGSQGRRRHLRGRFGDLRQRGLRGHHQGDARRDRSWQKSSSLAALRAGGATRRPPRHHHRHAARCGRFCRGRRRRRPWPAR